MVIVLDSLLESHLNVFYGLNVFYSASTYHIISTYHSSVAI